MSLGGLKVVRLRVIKWPREHSALCRRYYFVWESERGSQQVAALTRCFGSFTPSKNCPLNYNSPSEKSGYFWPEISHTPAATKLWNKSAAAGCGSVAMEARSPERIKQALQTFTSSDFLNTSNESRNITRLTPSLVTGSYYCPFLPIVPAWMQTGYFTLPRHIISLLVLIEACKRGAGRGTEELGIILNVTSLNSHICWVN